MYVFEILHKHLLGTYAYSCIHALYGYALFAHLYKSNELVCITILHVLWFACMCTTWVYGMIYAYVICAAHICILSSMFMYMYYIK